MGSPPAAQMDAKQLTYPSFSILPLQPPENNGLTFQPGINRFSNNRLNRFFENILAYISLQNSNPLTYNSPDRE
ncbi:hypothetical protein HZH68_007309 [Vespula germanica]|uniref:Uncharacterized protein n=1 Tax=Vespula germanica TaxID=30212 RepID=A0A834KAT2_VESGE|nr:hypothetical protein HZH68_007309 [Vespula germanica]